MNDPESFKAIADVREMPPRGRHPLIFGSFDSLAQGEALMLINDHDPHPLLDQLRQHYGDNVDICYQQREPGQIVIDFGKQA